MNLIALLMIGFFILGAGGTVATIGRPRKPISNLDAILVLLFNALLILGVVSLAT